VNLSTITSIQPMPFDTRWFLPCAAILTALCCYAPIMSGSEVLDLERKQQSEILERIIVGATSCAFPLILDVVMNFDLPKEFVLSRWLFLGSLVVPNILMLASGNGNTLEVKYILCSNYSRQILVVGGLFNCLTGKTRVMEISRHIIYLSACVVMILGSNLHFMAESHHRLLTLFILIFGSISFVGAVCYAMAYLWYLCHQQTPFTSIEKYSGVLACLLFMNHVVRIFFQFPLAEYSLGNMKHKAIVDGVSAVLGFILPSRIAIENAALSNVSFFVFLLVLASF
jgi:hypothetical protein